MESTEQKLILLDISTGDRDRIKERLKKFVVTIEFHSEMRYALIEINPGNSRDHLDSILSQIQLHGYNVKRRCDIADDEWEFLNQKLVVPEGKTNCSSIQFYREHFYLYDPRNLSFDEEFDKFINRTTMGPQDICDRHRMLHELQTILPFGQIHIFGSFLTQVGHAQSDVDVYFEDFERRKKEIVIKHVELAIDMATVDNRKICTIIQSLPHIRIPIITFLHKETNVKCDISFENIMSIQNSRLIRFLISLDPVVRPLIILIRMWARFHSLIHRDGIKNYTIALLVLVLLLRKKILPSVQSLQRFVPPLLVGVWNVAFCDDVDTLRRVLKWNSSNYTRPSDIIPFVLDFFDMILSISEKVTVCTMTGEFLRRVKFAPGNEDELPDSQERFLLWSSRMKQNGNGQMTTQFMTKKRLSIQDPFDLSYNIAGSCNDHHYHRFIHAVRETSSRIRSSLPTKLLNFFIPLKREMKVKGRSNKKQKTRTDHPNSKSQVKCANTNQSGASSSSKSQRRTRQINIIHPNPSFTQLLTVDKKFKSAFFSLVHWNDESREDLLCKLNRLWYKAFVAFFKKGIDHELQFLDRTKGRSSRGDIKRAIILIENNTSLTRLESQFELVNSNLEELSIEDENEDGGHFDMSNFLWMTGNVIRSKYENLSMKIPHRHTIQFEFSLSGTNGVLNLEKQVGSSNNNTTKWMGREEYGGNQYHFSCSADFELTRKGPQITVIISWSPDSHSNNVPLRDSYVSVMKKKLQNIFPHFTIRRFENWLIFPTKSKKQLQ